MASCIGGKMHGEVLTRADNPNEWQDERWPDCPSPSSWFGYCADCGQRFRWSIVMQRWLHFPGPTVALPQLDAEELERLQIASSTYRDALPTIAIASAETVERLQLIHASLETAIMEALQTIVRMGDATEA